MICRTCLRRQAAGLTPRSIASIVPRASFSTIIPLRNAAKAGAAAATPDLTPLTPPPPPPPTGDAATTTATEAGEKAPLSSCHAGTVLNGLNYFKGKSDPVALPDDQYPEWLWNCLEVQKKVDTEADAEAGDEFSKSKKLRRLAAKRQRTLEAKILASGDLEALAPKIPLQKQSINLPGSEDGDVKDAIQAADKREELRRAMRKERKAKIKETNYLKTM
ncbi:mitochondrial ribosomal protein L37-domain-containing protein [Diplogelasinospora grovesii]|uniref:Large ribosomal subunit protein mL54 n=1 Tax=Diplogelasinospora grovesii TaxID=303347 RepID=A0AAN6SA19_9PEZI|nr:mitochondrial ribosomal protein L37-domain-containing protein [Diplogelasinospora grovesii]